MFLFYELLLRFGQSGLESLRALLELVLSCLESLPLRFDLR